MSIIHFEGGKGLQAEEIARMIYDAVKQYAESEKYTGCLRRVTIVTFKAGVLEKFVSAIRSHTSPIVKRGSLLSRKFSIPSGFSLQYHSQTTGFWPLLAPKKLSIKFTVSLKQC